MFLLRVKLMAPGEKRETARKTCNETMLRDKLRVFVSRISPPLHSQIPVTSQQRLYSFIPVERFARKVLGKRHLHGAGSEVSQPMLKIPNSGHLSTLAGQFRLQI